MPHPSTPSFQEALCRGYLTAEQLEAAAAAAPVLDLRVLVGARPLALPQAVHVIGFSDEEGVRWELRGRVGGRAGGGWACKAGGSRIKGGRGRLHRER